MGKVRRDKNQENVRTVLLNVDNPSYELVGKLSSRNPSYELGGTLSSRHQHLKNGKRIFQGYEY